MSRHCRSHRAVEVSHDVAEGLTSFKSGANPADVKIYENPMSFGIIEFSNAGDPLVAEPSCTDGTPVLCPWATIEARLGSAADRLDIWTFASAATILGGAGNDEIWAHDGDVDEVDCGANWDEVYVDSSDVVAASCERVTIGPGPADPRFDNALARAAALRTRVTSVW